MSLLQKSMPIQVIPLVDNQQGNKYQGVLQSLDSEFIVISVDPEYLQQPPSEAVRLEFTMQNYQYHFDSEVVSRSGNALLSIKKPTKLYRSAIRRGRRLSVCLPINFTIWTETGRYDATMTDLSPVGLKMQASRFLQKNTLLSLNVYIPGKLRFICQGLVRWCRSDPGAEGVYECGVLFTTLSNDAAKRVARYVEEELSKQGGANTLSEQDMR